MAVLSPCDTSSLMKQFYLINEDIVPSVIKALHNHKAMNTDEFSLMTVFFVGFFCSIFPFRRGNVGHFVIVAAPRDGHLLDHATFSHAFILLCEGKDDNWGVCIQPWKKDTYLYKSGHVGLDR